MTFCHEALQALYWGIQTPGRLTSGEIARDMVAHQQIQEETGRLTPATIPAPAPVVTELLPWNHMEAA